MVSIGITSGNKGKKVTDDSKKVNGKTYYFNEDGEMLTGWHQDGDDAFYLGGEDEGWRAESQWLWLEKSGLDEDDLDDDDNLKLFSAVQKMTTAMTKVGITSSLP